MEGADKVFISIDRFPFSLLLHIDASPDTVTGEPVYSAVRAEAGTQTNPVTDTQAERINKEWHRLAVLERDRTRLLEEQLKRERKYYEGLLEKKEKEKKKLISEIIKVGCRVTEGKERFIKEWFDQADNK